jgi:hypothetical protein
MCKNKLNYINGDYKRIYDYHKGTCHKYILLALVHGKMQQIQFAKAMRIATMLFRHFKGRETLVFQYM